MALTPRPSPPGTDDMKALCLGRFICSAFALIWSVALSLVSAPTTWFAPSISLLPAPTSTPLYISADASGHMGLVLLQAGVLDRRIRHIEVDHVLTSYRSLIDAPAPTGAPEDVIPGVLLLFDVPDLVRALGARLKVSNPLSGVDDLSQESTPLNAISGATP